ncbi:MAG: HEPN domain-containing protein [Endomicrobiia bacterium]
MEDEKNFLKNRAKEFWERAKEDLQKFRYNLAALDVEQAVQLWLKHLIFLKADDFPKVHYLDRLINELSIVYDCPKISNFYKEHALEFRSLEDAYITSRYFSKEFNKEEIERLIEFTAAFFKFLKEQINEELV